MVFIALNKGLIYKLESAGDILLVSGISQSNRRKATLKKIRHTRINNIMKFKIDRDLFYTKMYE